MDNNDSQYKLRSEALVVAAPIADTLPPDNKDGNNDNIITTADPAPNTDPDPIVKSDPEPTPIVVIVPDAAPKTEPVKETKKNCFYCIAEDAANLSIRWGIAIVLLALAYNLIKQYGGKGKAAKAA